MGVLLTEKWKPIPGYNDVYWISSHGRVWNNKKCYYRKLSKHRKNYFRVGLNRDGRQKYYYVHRLVAKVFIPNPKKFKEINHIKGFSNYFKNLEWCDRVHNMKHAVLSNLVPKGEDNYKAKLTNKEARLIKRLIKEKYRLITIQGMIPNCKYYMVMDIKRGRSWKHIKV